MAATPVPPRREPRPAWWRAPAATPVRMSVRMPAAPRPPGRPRCTDTMPQPLPSTRRPAERVAGKVDAEGAYGSWRSQVHITCQRAKSPPSARKTAPCRPPVGKKLTSGCRKSLHRTAAGPAGRTFASRGRVTPAGQTPSNPCLGSFCGGSRLRPRQACPITRRGLRGPSTAGTAVGHTGRMPAPRHNATGSQFAQIA